MKSPVRPELPTAALRSSQAMHAAGDNSVPLATRPKSTYINRGKLFKQPEPPLISNQSQNRGMTTNIITIPRIP